jgi:hypothetical protein
MANFKRSNVSRRERERLVELVEAAVELVESKRTDAFTTAQKDAEWKSIVEQYNLQSDEPKTSVQLHNLWKNLKQTAKKEFGKMRRHALTTGAGEAPEDPDPISVRIAALLPSHIHPLDNEFDCDAPLGARNPFVSNDPGGTLILPDDNTYAVVLPRDPIHQADDLVVPEVPTTSVANERAKYNEADVYQVKLLELCNSQLKSESLKRKLMQERNDREIELHEASLALKQAKTNFYNSQTAALKAVDKKFMNDL